MKSVEMTRDYDFHIKDAKGRPSAGAPNVSYRKGVTYQRVPEAHAEAIVSAGAGTVTTSAAEPDENVGG